MQDVIKTGGALVLRTGMTNREFAQANMMQHLKAAGYLARRGENAGAEGGEFPQNPNAAAYSFCEWKFERTAMEGDVFTLEGEPFGGVPLYDVLAEIEAGAQGGVCTAPSDAQKRGWRKVYAVIRAMHDAQNAGITLPNAGAIGILVDESLNVLFLPEALVVSSVAVRSQKDAADLAESWRQPVLPTPELCPFTAAALVYTALCGSRPFAAQTPEALSEDFLDKRFVPLKYRASVNAALAELVSTMLNAKIKFRPQLKKLLALLPQNIEEAYVPQSESKCANAAALQKFSAKMERSVKGMRFVRKNFGAISIGALVAVFLAAIGVSIINNDRARPTSHGLTAYQTVESFYSSLNHLQTDGVEACTTKRVGKHLTQMVSSLFVVSKMQSAYTKSIGLLTPAQWMALSDFQRDQAVYGLCQFRIDGAAADSSAAWFDTANKDEITGEEGETAKFTAEYYLVSSEDDEVLCIEKYRDALTLTYTKGCWLISDILRESKPSWADKQQVFENLKAGNFGEYAWLPTEAEQQAGKEELKRMFEF